MVEKNEVKMDWLILKNSALVNIGVNLLANCAKNCSSFLTVDSGMPCCKRTHSSLMLLPLFSVESQSNTMMIVKALKKAVFKYLSILS